MSRLKRAFSRAKHAALFAAIGGGLGGIVGRNSASSGAALGALIGATIGEKRATPGSITERIKDGVGEKLPTAATNAPIQVDN